jgi:hypothetical protein
MEAPRGYIVTKQVFQSKALNYIMGPAGPSFLPLFPVVAIYLSCTCTQMASKVPVTVGSLIPLALEIFQVAFKEAKKDCESLEWVLDQRFGDQEEHPLRRH